MNTPRLQNALKALLLMALGFFLYSRIANGSLYFYINQRFVVLILLAVVGLLAVAISYQFATDRAHQPNADAELDHEDEHEHLSGHHHHHPGYDHEHSHEPSHDQGHSHGLTWSGALLLALPVVLGLLVPPQPLGASALSNREMETGVERSRMPATVRNARAKTDVEKNILDWAYEFDADNPGAIVGKEANVVGFVFHEEAANRADDEADNEADNEERFLLARYVVSCCVADAAYVGLTVQWPENSALTEDQWVRVHGHLDTYLVDGIQRPILIADEVEPTVMPSQPYLYP